MQRRADELGIDIVRTDVGRKGPVFDSILADLGIEADAAALDPGSGVAGGGGNSSNGASSSGMDATEADAAALMPLLTPAPRSSRTQSAISGHR